MLLVTLQVRWTLSKSFGRTTSTLFGAAHGAHAKELLLSRHIVMNLKSETGAPDPFLLTLLADSNVDAAMHDSWWHLTVVNQSPRRFTFRKMLPDSTRVEPMLHPNEIKLKAHYKYLNKSIAKP